jgi:hypothetical protein
MTIATRIALIAFAALLAACESTPTKPEPPAPKAVARAAEPPPPKPAEPAEAAAPKPAEAPAPATPVANKGESHLGTGLAAYENGDYKTARYELQAALTQGLANRADRINAHKHLAFVACATGQREACKDHFRRVLAINSRFALTKAEAGHPIWGPVFIEAKTERAGKAPDATKK